MMSGFNPASMLTGGNDFSSALQQMFGGMFGNSGRPFVKGMDELKNYFGQAMEKQNPFYNAGTGAIGNTQDWLSKMKDPSAFINNLMGGYQQSPWAKNMQQQSMNAATNMGSASGLTGSTPMMQQAQQNAGNISSQDQNQWLQNVLGVNNQYGAGQQHMMDMGANSANTMSQLLAQLGINMGQGAYGQAAGQNQDRMNSMGGIFKMLFG